MKDDAKSLSFVEDTAVAPERLRDYIERFLAIVQRHGTTAGVYAHASVGCLHVRPVINMKTEDGVRRFESIANDVSDLVLEFGGALSGEHGDGLVRSPFMEKMFGPEIYEAFRTIKRTFDPHGIFNPGKIVDAPPLTANLRFGSGYVTRSVHDLFRLLRKAASPARSRCAAGSARAARRSRARCVPRTWRRATSSTRRAGGPTSCAWRSSGRLGEAGLGDQGVYDDARSVSRVPGVQGGVPGRRGRRALQERIPRRLLAATRHAAPRAGARAGAARRRVGQPARAALELDRQQRDRPSAERARAGHRPAATRCRSSSGARSADRRRKAACRRHLTCCSSTTRSPITTIRRSDSPRSTCCRPPASTGARREPLLRAAADFEGTARRGARRWRRGTPTCCSPTPLPAGRWSSASRAACRRSARMCRHCCAARRGGGRKSSRRAACCSRSFSPRARRRLAAAKPGRRRSCSTATAIRSRCRCVAPAKALLSSIPGTTVVDLDAGCCGMAGSFGYAREHYEVSRAIGERQALSRSAQQASRRGRRRRRHLCRHQIADFTGESAVHPAVLLAQLIEPTQ